MAYYIFLHLPESFCVLYYPIFHFQLLYSKTKGQNDKLYYLFNWTMGKWIWFLMVFTLNSC